MGQPFRRQGRLGIGSMVDLRHRRHCDCRLSLSRGLCTSRPVCEQYQQNLCWLFRRGRRRVRIHPTSARPVAIYLRRFWQHELRCCRWRHVSRAIDQPNVEGRTLLEVLNLIRRSRRRPAIPKQDLGTSACRCHAAARGMRLPVPRPGSTNRRRVLKSTVIPEPVESAGNSEFRVRAEVAVE